MTIAGVRHHDLFAVIPPPTTTGAYYGLGGTSGEKYSEKNAKEFPVSGIQHPG